MNDYKSILILHAEDKSTAFLASFKSEFNEIYHSFGSDEDSISYSKSLIGDLKPKSLIIYLGHGSSSGLYEPDDSQDYESFFLDATLGNHYFDEHDIILLSCKSNEYIKKIYKSNYAIGFGNIISSKAELDFHNKYNEPKKKLSLDEINIFNNIYVNCSIMVVKKLINESLDFQDIPNYIRFCINKEINNVLLNKKDNNRVELSTLLFEFRDQIILQHNLR